MVDFTDKVLEYQKTKNPRILKEIQSGVSHLIWSMIRKYGMANYPKIIIEDITENCRTYKLMASIDTYDPTRGAKWETHFSWYLRSECTWKKKYYLRRLNLEFTPSEQVFLHPENISFENKEIVEEAEQIKETAPDNEEDTTTEILDRVETYNWQEMKYLKRELAQVFNC